MKEHVKGSLFLLSATIIWGFAFIAQSVGMDSIGPFTFQSVRCFLAVLFLFPCSILLEWKKYGIRNALLRWKNPHLWKNGFFCGCALFVAASLQQVGLVYTDAGKAGFITAMYIVLVPILGLFLGKKPPKTIVLSVLIAVIGLYLLSCQGVSRINKGDLMLMGCALAFSVQINCIDALPDSIDGLRLNCIQSLTVSLLSIPFIGLWETVVVADLLSCWFPLCFAGILSMGLAYTFQVKGQQLVEASPAALIMSLESVFAALGGWLLLNERMSSWEYLGCCLVFLAVILSQLPLDVLLRKKKLA